jgi:hypothetical protein
MKLFRARLLKYAKKIAIQKCYEFVSKELGKIGYNDCYIDLTVDETVQGKVAEFIK